MKYGFQAACLLAVGAMLTGGCASKKVQSVGETSYALRNGSTGSGVTASDLSTQSAERLSPGVLYAKADPSAASRQMAEIRAEQSATMAAGLRDVFFGYDSWAINEEGRQALTKDADWLRTHAAAQIKIEGHCDERGSSTYNLVLAEKRAKSVRNYLMELGVNTSRLTVVSYGKERPFCNDRSESCFQQNRRGHIVVKP